MKEVRPASSGSTEIRILYIFDRKRNCVLLVARDKSGKRNEWYDDSIPLAKERYARLLSGDYDEDRN